MNATLAEPEQLLLLGVIESGVSRTARRLEVLSGGRWTAHVISVEAGDGPRFRSILTRDDSEHHGVSFRCPGETYLALFSCRSCDILTAAGPFARAALRGVPGARDAALQETANVLVSGISASLGDRNGMARLLSAPTAHLGRKAEILDEAFPAAPAAGPSAALDSLIHLSAPDLDADCTVLVRLDGVAAGFLLRTDPDARSTGRA